MLSLIFVRSETANRNSSEIIHDDGKIAWDEAGNLQHWKYPEAQCHYVG